MQTLPLQVRPSSIVPNCVFTPILEVLRAILADPMLVPHEEWIDLLRRLPSLGDPDVWPIVLHEVGTAWEYVRIGEEGAALHHLRQAIAKVEALQGRERRRRRYRRYRAVA